MKDENSTTGVFHEKKSSKSFRRSESLVVTRMEDVPTLDWLQQWDLCIALAALVPETDTAVFVAAREKCEDLNRVIELEENYLLKEALDITDLEEKRKAVEAALAGRPKLMTDLANNDALKSSLAKDPSLALALEEFPTPASEIEKIPALKTAFETTARIGCRYLSNFERGFNEAPATRKETRGKLNKVKKLLRQIERHRNHPKEKTIAANRLIGLVESDPEFEERLLRTDWKRENWPGDVWDRPRVFIPGVEAVLAELESRDSNGSHSSPKPRPGKPTLFAEREAFADLTIAYEILTGKVPSRSMAENEGTDSRFARFFESTLQAVRPGIVIDAVWWTQILPKSGDETAHD